MNEISKKKRKGNIEKKMKQIGKIEKKIQLPILTSIPFYDFANKKGGHKINGK